jgi:site-specific recombinase XerD
LTLSDREILEFRNWALTDGRLSPRTVEKALRYIRFLEQRGFTFDRESYLREQLLERLVLARDDGVAPITLNLWVAQLNRWARFLRKEWKLPRYRHHHEPDVPAPNQAEARKIWNLTWTEPTANSRNRAIIALLLDKGPRRQELVDLNLGDFVQTRDGPSMVIRHGKGDKERTIPVAAEVAVRLRDYLDHHRSPSDPRAFFTTPNGRVTHGYVGKIVKLAGERLGLHWLSSHKLRHFATDDLLDRGVSVASVAEILGHESVETTMMYRTKRLSRKYAESEVRNADRRRFETARTRKVRSQLDNADSTSRDADLPPPPGGSTSDGAEGSNNPRPSDWTTGHGGIQPRGAGSLSSPGLNAFLSMLQGELAKEL